jgi:hypothetical protein
LTSVRELVQAEIARREEATSAFLPFCYTVHDAPDAMTDVAAAVAAVMAEHATRVGNGGGKAAPPLRPPLPTLWRKPWLARIRSISPGLVG